MYFGIFVWCVTVLAWRERQASKELKAEKLGVEGDGDLEMMQGPSRYMQMMGN